MNYFPWPVSSRLFMHTSANAFLKIEFFRWLLMLLTLQNRQIASWAYLNGCYIYRSPFPLRKQYCRIEYFDAAGFHDKGVFVLAAAIINTCPRTLSHLLKGFLRSESVTSGAIQMLYASAASVLKTHRITSRHNTYKWSRTRCQEFSSVP